jgi:hypothetical protein
MKVLFALAVLVAFATSAAATPSPFEPRPAAPAIDDSPLYLGPVGAMLESDYFRAPQPPAGAGRIFPCRLRLHAISREPRFAQVCD